jgi:hypothetical protein
MLGLRRVKFFVRMTAFCMARLRQLLAESLYVPQPIGVWPETSHNACVGDAISPDDVFDAALVREPSGNPIEMRRFIPQQDPVRMPHRVWQVHPPPLVAEVAVNTVLEHVSQREHFRERAWRSDLLRIERLITAANSNRWKRQRCERPLPEPRMPRLIGAVLRELVNQMGVIGLPNHSAQQQCAFELALTVPVQSPGEATLHRHDQPPRPSCAAAFRSAV